MNIDQSCGITLSLATSAESPLLKNLLELYEYDFSEFTGSDVGADGTYQYQYLNEYWIEPNRFVYIAFVRGKIAGFVMVNTHFIDNVLRWSIAEFFVLRKYRRQGIGEYMAKYAFNQHPGQWVIMQIGSNLAAIKFWRKVVTRYTGGKYDECEGTGDGQAGVMQLFNNG